MNPEVTTAVETTDSYKDISVFAIPTRKLKESTIIPENKKEEIAKKLTNVPGLPDVGDDPLVAWDGRGWKTELPQLDFNTELSALQADEVIFV